MSGIVYSDYDNLQRAFMKRLHVLSGATKIVVLSQAEYDSITPDANVLYFIKDE